MGRNESPPVLTSDQFFSWCLECGTDVAPLFSLPGVSTGTILVDWLHCVELGISQDAAGNVLWQAIHKAGFLPGASREARLTHLNGMLRAFNAELKPSNPIQLLTENMIKRAGKSPKLKSKGAESRGLRLWIKQLAERLVQHHPSEAHIRMLCCIDALVACSSFVDREPFDLGEFQRTGDAHLEHYAWLSQHFADEDLWRYKPKHHQFFHLLHTVAPKHGSPNTYWCWADESLGGQFAKAALRRGGKASPSITSLRLMQRVAALGWVQ